jgi:hypothetical protein
LGKITFGVVMKATSFITALASGFLILTALIPLAHAVENPEGNFLTFSFFAIIK